MHLKLWCRNGRKSETNSFTSPCWSPGCRNRDAVHEKLFGDTSAQLYLLIHDERAKPHSIALLQIRYTEQSRVWYTTQLSVYLRLQLGRIRKTPKVHKLEFLWVQLPPHLLSLSLVSVTCYSQRLLSTLSPNSTFFIWLPVSRQTTSPWCNPTYPGWECRRTESWEVGRTSEWERHLVVEAYVPWACLG